MNGNRATICKNDTVNEEQSRPDWALRKRKHLRSAGNVQRCCWSPAGKANGQSMQQPSGNDLEAATIHRVYWRIIPLFFVMMFFNYLDRINIGFAALRMNQDLDFGPAVFGFGASIFFVGYMLLEVPSNLMLRRVGASAPFHTGTRVCRSSLMRCSRYPVKRT